MNRKYTNNQLVLNFCQLTSNIKGNKRKSLIVGFDVVNSRERYCGSYAVLQIRTTIKICLLQCEGDIVFKISMEPRKCENNQITH